MIEVQNISKSYGDIEALKKVSFTINKGEIFGLLGPNGAGKSTTINILNTLINPDQGNVILNGLNIRDNKDKCKSILGVVPQEIALYEDLSAFDNLMFWGSLYNIPKAKLLQKVSDVLEMVGLSNRKKDSIKTFSGGMKRRINIASSILHSPKILLMDEPTVGVDPQSRNHVFEVIEKLNNDGMTIIYTTHYMEEAERLCDQIAIIDLGKIIASGNLSELRNSSDSNDLIIIQLSELNEEIRLKLLDKIHTATIAEGSNTIQIQCDNISNEIADVIYFVQNTGAVISNLETKRANLESIFLKLTGKHLRD